jgi:hypothetical protein
MKRRRGNRPLDSSRCNADDDEDDAADRMTCQEPSSVDDTSTSLTRKPSIARLDWAAASDVPLTAGRTSETEQLQPSAPAELPGFPSTSYAPAWFQPDPLPPPAELAGTVSCPAGPAPGHALAYLNTDSTVSVSSGACWSGAQRPSAPSRASSIGFLAPVGRIPCSRKRAAAAAAAASEAVAALNEDSSIAPCWSAPVGYGGGAASAPGPNPFAAAPSFGGAASAAHAAPAPAPRGPALVRYHLPRYTAPMPLGAVWMYRAGVELDEMLTGLETPCHLSLTSRGSMSGARSVMAGKQWLRLRPAGHGPAAMAAELAAAASQGGAAAAPPQPSEAGAMGAARLPDAPRRSSNGMCLDTFLDMPLDMLLVGEELMSGE